MLKRLNKAVVTLALIAVAVGACGKEEEVSDVGYDAMKGAVDSGNPAGFDPFKGKTVRWTGTVTEAVIRRGDDYVEEAHLYVDMDGGADPAPDVTMTITPDVAKTLNAGESITFVAVLREIARDETKPMVRAELKEIEGK